MSDTIIQYCYTNVNGWRPVAVRGAGTGRLAGEIARHASMYENDPNAGAAVSDVLETIGVDTAVLLIRTRYGIRDFGAGTRKNMFSHGYEIPLEGEFDPNAFLTVADSNFSTDIAGAEQPRDAFDRLPPFSPETAMAMAGLTPERYAALLRAVYQAAVRSTIKTALTLRWRGGEAEKRALMYCIYRGLPPHIARKLSISGARCHLSELRTVVIDDAAGGQSRFFDPDTGESDVLTENVDKNLRALGFVDFVARCGLNGAQAAAYFAALSANADALGGGTDDETMRAAHYLTVYPTGSALRALPAAQAAQIAAFLRASRFADNKQVLRFLDLLGQSASGAGAAVPAPGDVPMRPAPERAAPAVPAEGQAKGPARPDPAVNAMNERDIRMVMPEIERLHPLLLRALPGEETLPAFERLWAQASQLSDDRNRARLRALWLNEIGEALARRTAENVRQGRACFETMCAAAQLCGAAPGDALGPLSAVLSAYWAQQPLARFDPALAEEYDHMRLKRLGVDASQEVDADRVAIFCGLSALLTEEERLCLSDFWELARTILTWGGVWDTESDSVGPDSPLFRAFLTALKTRYGENLAYCGSDVICRDLTEMGLFDRSFAFSFALEHMPLFFTAQYEEVLAPILEDPGAFTECEGAAMLGRLLFDLAVFNEENAEHLPEPDARYDAPLDLWLVCEILSGRELFSTFTAAKNGGYAPKLLLTRPAALAPGSCRLLDVPHIASALQWAAGQKHGSKWVRELAKAEAKRPAQQPQAEDAPAAEAPRRSGRFFRKQK